MKNEVIVTADKIRKKKRKERIVKIALLTLLLLLIALYIILRIIYSEGKFTITLDSNETLKSGIAIFDDPEDPTARRKLEASKIEFLDNISVKWLPENIDDEYKGSHNGPNYIAYTFYIENQGKEIQNYWYEVEQLDVIKNVDDAVRFMVILNGEKTIYAKKNELSGEPEEGTEMFRDENPIILEQRKDFRPGDRDRFTIVIWLEGDDPECVDAIIGGEIKLEMKITEEHINKIIK